MEDADKRLFVTNVTKDYLATNDTVPNDVVYRKDVENHAINRFGAKFNRIRFWPFVKIRCQYKVSMSNLRRMWCLRDAHGRS